MDFKVNRGLEALLSDSHPPLPIPTAYHTEGLFPPSLPAIARWLYHCQIWPLWNPDDETPVWGSTGLGAACAGS